MGWVRTAWFAIGVLAAGCAVPPERAEREAALRSAIEPCLQRYPSVKLTGIDAYGQVYGRAREQDEVAGFEQCSKDGVESAGLARLGTGKLAAGATQATVAIRSVYSAILVPVRINGLNVTLVLDTGASQTMLRGSVVGGQRVAVPLVRARSVSVGSAAVEDIDVGVFDALPGRPEVDGLLGASFLAHFKFTVDRKNLQLVLEPVVAEK